MLTDPREIEIISRARQANVRDYRRSRQHFVNILADFFEDRHFVGRRCLDLGPGQYDFGVLARERGAAVVGIDNDPAVIELGRHKGFDVVKGNLRSLSVASFDAPFDGVFCKFSINCFWFGDDVDALADFSHRLAACVRPEGWLWVAPWNGVPKTSVLDGDEQRRILDRQQMLFEVMGCEALDLSPKLAARYGVTGRVANHALFVRGLKKPPAVTRQPGLLRALSLRLAAARSLLTRTTLLPMRSRRDDQA
jgi:Methyltransferase domain